MALTVSAAVISTHVSAQYRFPLYVITVGWAAVAVVQTVRALVATRRHDIEIAELRADQEYLAQPERQRTWDLIFKHHAALTVADDRFRENFEIDSREAMTTTVVCRTCGWRATRALLYAREEALDHLDNAHPPLQSKQGWRIGLRGRRMRSKNRAS